ncbi:cupin domain-containing protein [Synechococcus sp. PCC 6312]|uniref:cupin domain-containing protein n=1 Tax=Synechococcus sp. (strain ATCC 27167 / PCC 6312) TaxID=195253 RepID=UPI00029ED150|nr:cupin domain-containing protein [Synechococcus sp. PCC 6312]AFY62318.1 hypothetical protein Syn6312_3274 [Synechococcus sp. PCC 6312]
MSITAETWITGLGLEPHPEGGYFRETYRATGIIPGQALPPNFAGGDRNYGTAIYFLLQSGQFSALHRIQADEVWHFYAGSGLTVVVISPEGERTDLHLGADIDQGQQFQAWVPAGAWFGAYVNEPESYSLVGCTVAPGFDFRDFEMGERNKLLAAFPHHQDLITCLTHP